MSGFAGFPFAGLDFYEDLEADNSKTFWAANKLLSLSKKIRRKFPSYSTSA